MEFEYDPEKSAANREKYGIDFAEAQEMWDGRRMVEASAISRDEPRFMALAVHDGNVWAAVYKLRGDIVRLISVGRAAKGEAEGYEQTSE